jgi:hypothetical protein
MVLHPVFHMSMPLGAASESHNKVVRRNVAITVRIDKIECVETIRGGKSSTASVAIAAKEIAF